MKRYAIAALGSVMLAGCILVADFSGIDDGPASPSGDEHTPIPIDDGGEGDALRGQDASDGSTMDGGAPDGDAPCTFCDSFDTVPDGLNAWSEKHGLVSAVNAGDAPSAPKVLHAQLPDGGASYVKATPNGIAPTKKASLSFSVSPESMGTSGGAVIAALYIGNHRLQLFALNDRLRLIEDDGSSGPSYDTAALDTGTWTKLTIGTDGDRIYLLRGGVKVIDQPVKSTWIAKTDYTVVIGIHFLLFSPAGSFAFRFDDVRFTTP